MDQNILKHALFDKIRPITMESDSNQFNFSGVNFKSELKRNASGSNPWAYIENEARLNLQFVEMRWDTGDIIKDNNINSIGSIEGNNTKYADALGEGIDIRILQSNHKWQKIIDIYSITALGSIPIDATYLEVSFEISGDFSFPDGEMTDRLSFGENSFINPVCAWDSSSDNIESENENGVYGIITNNIITKRIPVAWLESAMYPVCTDTTITFGSENVFSSVFTNYISVAMLDSTHFVVAYKNEVSNYGTAIVGEVSETTISSYGAENIFNYGSTERISVAALDSTHFVIAYRDEGNSYRGTAIVGEVSGTTISSYGAENIFKSVSTSIISVAAISSTRFIVSYSSTYCRNIIGDVSGTTISSYGSEYTYTTQSSGSVNMALLDSTHFVCVYRDGSNLDQGTAIIGSISGTTISYGTPNIFAAEEVGIVVVAALDSTHFVISYEQENYYGAAIVGEVSGTTISSYGTPNVYNTNSTPISSITALDSNYFAVAYQNGGHINDAGSCVIGSVSGTTITYGEVNIFNNAVTGNTLGIWIATLDPTHFVISYRDGGNSDYGTGIIGSIPVSFIPTIIIS